MTTAESRVGTTFGHYELKSLLGKGGMGEVYRAYDTAKGRTVAIKILRDQFADDERFRVRFERESRAAAILQEPHVIPIHDWGEIDGNLYIDMRLVEGRTLYELIEGGPLDPHRAIAIIEQIGAALDAAHAEGLIHRDVKPQNVIVTPSDFAYLLDFGIVGTQTDTRLTLDGSAIGSIAYMAPERFTDEQCTHGADVYSLACVLFEAITGTTPFPTNTYERLIASHLSAPAPRPSDLVSTLPTSLDDVVARGMSKRPEDRYGSAGDLGRAALRALDSNAVSPDAETREAPRASMSQRATVAAPSVVRADRPTDDPANGPLGRGDRRSHLPLAVLGVVAALLLGALGLVIGMLVSRDGRATDHARASSTPTSNLAAPAVTSQVAPTLNRTAPPVTLTKTTTVAAPTAAWPTEIRTREITGVVSGTCDEGGTCGVKQRTEPYTNAPRLVPNDLQDGTVVTLVCQTIGDMRTNEGHGSSFYWYRLVNGAYVNSVYFNMSASAIPSC